MVATHLLTAADLEAMGDEAERYELIRGGLREVEGMGGKHGAIGGDLHTHIGMHVVARDLGAVFISDTRFVIRRNPDSVLAPDFAYIRSDRLPLGDIWDSYVPIAPDLVVEVVSPSSNEADILDKVAIYLAGGVRLIWLVRPKRRTVTVFRPHQPEIILGEGDVLDGDNVLPGFALPVSAIFRRPGHGSR